MMNETTAKSNHFAGRHMAVFKESHFGNRQAERAAGRALTLILQSANCTSTPLARKDWPIGLKTDGVGHITTHTLT